MRRFVIIMSVVFLVAGVARAEITALLEVVADQVVAGGPYRRAELTVTNSSATVAETVLLKPSGVGMTVRYKLAVPPGAAGRQIVFLPAISPTQEYALTALDASGEVIARTSASITWPAELVTTDAFIEDAFRAWTDEPARWSAKTRWNYILILAMFVTAAAATLLIRRPLLRIAAVVVIAGAVTAMIVFVFIPAGPETVRVHRYFLTLHDGAGGMKPDSFAVLTARRTTEWSRRISHWSYPVYPDRAAAANDETIVKPATGVMRLTLHPCQVRIIRPAWQDGPETDRLGRRGSVRQETNGFAIETVLVSISGNALLIRNDSVWRIGPADGTPKAFAPANQAQSYGAFMNGKDGQNLNHHDRRILNYWRNKYQQADKFYLVEPGGFDDVTRIEVVRLVETPSETTTKEISNVEHNIE